MERRKLYFIIIVGIIIGIIISIGTSYVLAESLIDSQDVYYKDNSNLLADNVQDAIDGTCTKFENKVDNFLDKIYPVGSIYISTTFSTVEQVKEALGGEWESYGNNMVLRGTNSKAEVTGGNDTVTLTTDNLPSHTHSFTPAGSVASTFKGTAVTSGTQSANHTHTFSGTTGGSGSHSHTIGLHADSSVVSGHFYDPPIGGQNHTAYLGPGVFGVGNTSSVGNHTHSFSGTTGSNSANHTHSVTAAGTVSSTFTGTASNTGATGGGKSISVQDSYITVFMYKRIK